MARARRTTHRSSAGKKLYAVRAADGSFRDIQTYERAHRDDIAHSSSAERAAKKAAKKAAKTAAKKATKKTAKTTAKTTARKTAARAARTSAKKR